MIQFTVVGVLLRNISGCRCVGRINHRVITIALHLSCNVGGHYIVSEEGEKLTEEGRKETIKATS